MIQTWFGKRIQIGWNLYFLFEFDRLSVICQVQGIFKMLGSY